MEVTTVRHNPFRLKKKRPLVRGFLLFAALAGAAVSLWWTFRGPGGDLRLLRLRVLMDGAAPRHRFFPGSDLAGQSFQELDLSRAVFPQCNLSGANFRNADLTAAALTGCCLDGADLRGSVLTRADLAGSSLRFALMAGARLGGADLAGADLTGVVGLPPAAVRRCRNWQQAIFDEDVSSSLRGGR
jgi:uncharacterized protein YjbI with pentapeptide repeats